MFAWSTLHRRRGTGTADQHKILAYRSSQRTEKGGKQRNRRSKANPAKVKLQQIPPDQSIEVTDALPFCSEGTSRIIGSLGIKSDSRNKTNSETKAP
ncbi:MAG: hypothetical protein LBJ36_07005 [Synergistaceae bacterium]|jgi:hypothetical protein|nr:hypothetical protein [Synergistaceae bacterium]